MAGPVGWPVSAHSISDWVTPFLISPKTWTKLSLVGSSLSSLDRECIHEVEMYLFFPLCRHPVWPDGGSVSSELGMYLYALLCRHLLSFDPVVRRTASCEVETNSPPPCFRLILTFCYCFYGFFRELDIASGRSLDRNKADPFHAPTRWAKLYDFAPDIQDAMELRALGPHAIFVKVISVWNSLGSQRIFPSDLGCGHLLRDLSRI